MCFNLNCNLDNLIKTIKLKAPKVRYTTGSKDVIESTTVKTREVVCVCKE